MTRSRARFTAVLAVAALALSASGTAQSDPFLGTWKLNPAKSKYSPGPAPKSQTTTYEAAGKGYKISVKSEPATGAMQEWSYMATLDGKESAITGTNPNADTIAVKRIDATTLEMTSKKGGKPTTTQRNVVSADGKTRTVTTTGTDAQGRTVNNTAVFEKQ
jgi:hypothetical protein